jgi:hypothetical protein
MFRKSFSRDSKHLSWVIDDGYPKIFNSIDECLNAIMLDILNVMSSLNVMSTYENDGTAKFWGDASSIYHSLKAKIWKSYVYGDIKWEFWHLSDVKYDDDKIHALLTATKNNLNKLIDKYENLLTNTSKNGECATVESINKEINENISLLSELIK